MRRQSLRQGLRRLRLAAARTKEAFSVVGPKVLGVPVLVHVLVSIEHGSRNCGEFARKLQQRSEVRHASYVTGGADFVLHLQVESMEAYADFAREVFHDDPNVAEYHTYVAMQEIVGPNSGRRVRGRVRPKTGAISGARCASSIRKFEVALARLEDLEPCLESRRSRSFRPLNSKFRHHLPI